MVSPRNSNKDLNKKSVMGLTSQERKQSQSQYVSNKQLEKDDKNKSRVSQENFKFQPVLKNTQSTKLDQELSRIETVPAQQTNDSLQ